MSAVALGRLCDRGVLIEAGDVAAYGPFTEVSAAYLADEEAVGYI